MFLHYIMNKNGITVSVTDTSDESNWLKHGMPSAVTTVASFFSWAKEMGKACDGIVITLQITH